jgi:hypothetical protein
MNLVNYIYKRKLGRSIIARPIIKADNASSCTNAGLSACAEAGGGLCGVLNGEGDVDNSRCRFLGSR